MSGEVLEGFLCPLCMKDLGDVIQLQVRRGSGWDQVALGEYPGYESPSAGFELSDNSNRD